MSRNSRRVTFHGGAEVSLATESVAAPGPGEVRVASTLVGLCGSDLHAVQGDHPFMNLPYSPGHEVVGTVNAVGEGVSDLAVGDRVVVEPNLTCGTCANCLAGNYNICETLAVFGCQTPGGMSDYFLIDASRLHLIPADLPDAYAALIEPLATPAHAVTKAGVGEEAKVAVLGAGTIGVLVAIVAKARGARQVVITDTDPVKRERALRLGIDVALSPEEFTQQIAEAQDFDVAFDCVTNVPSAAQAVGAVRKGGTVVVVGVPAESILFPLHLVQDRELRILGTLMYTKADYEWAMSYLADQPAGLDELITSYYGLEEAGAALAAALSGNEGKVVVTPGIEATAKASSP